MAELAEQGASVGQIAYGWQREPTLDTQGRFTGYRNVLHPQQTLVLRDAAVAVLAGDSLTSIIGRLNTQAIPAPSQGTWSITIMRSLLLRERNACRRVHQGKVVGVGDWDRVFDDDIHTRLVAIMRDPARRTNRSNAIKYLLSGIATCGVCGGPLRVLPDSSRRSTSYICNNGSHVRRNLTAVDDLVTQVVLARLAQPDALALFHDNRNHETEKLRAKTATLRAKLDLAADQYSDDIIDAQQFARVSTKLRPPTRRLRNPLARLKHRTRPARPSHPQHRRTLGRTTPGPQAQSHRPTGRGHRRPRDPTQQHRPVRPQQRANHLAGHLNQARSVEIDPNGSWRTPPVGVPGRAPARS